eukprot:1159204-Pelagomonas_calceolata.AAC.1
MSYRTEVKETRKELFKASAFPTTLPLTDVDMHLTLPICGRTALRARMRRAFVLAYMFDQCVSLRCRNR